MKAITPENQPRLGLARTVQITIDGMRYRLFRAAVTVSVIVVAVAFLMNILSESIIKREVAVQVRSDLSRNRTVHLLASRLTRLESPETMVKELEPKLQNIRIKNKEQLDRIQGELKGTSILVAFAEANEAFYTFLSQEGYTLEPGLKKVLQIQAQNALDTIILEDALKNPLARQWLAHHFDIRVAEVSIHHLYQALESSLHAEGFLKNLGPTSPKLALLSPDRLTELSLSRKRQIDLEMAERLTVNSGTGWMGLGERMTWLLMLSMLVCTIGIANAMLMAVTERFREIATLKCLGALDGFIMSVFVLESCFMGLVGGVIGSLIGNFIGFCRMMVSFGSMSFSAVIFQQLFLATLAAIIVGIVLAALASVYPAWKAARLAPMEAMRVE